MAFPVQITFADPPPGTCPATFDDGVNILKTLITGAVTTGYTPFIMGAATPSVDDQDKPWIRLDTNGAPMGTYVFFGGHWRRQYSVPLGTVTMVAVGPTNFDANGKGVPGGDWDGWHLCNGKDGIFDLSDRFIIAGHMSDDSIGWSAGWRTTATGSPTNVGGFASIELLTSQIPSDPITLTVGKWKADGNARDIAGQMYGDPGSDTTKQTTLTLDAGNASPDAINNMPPYKVLAYAIFIGYAP